MAGDEAAEPPPGFDEAAEPPPGFDEAAELAALVVARLTADGRTLAVAESLTGGQLAARLVDVPGASAVLRGGVVAYATDLKARLLGVDPDLLADRGPVDAEVAAQMAAGVRARLGADWGLSTTGVAGPDPQAGKLPGTVFVGVAGPDAAQVRALRLAGTRAEVRSRTVAQALHLLLFAVGEHPM
jgi:nicotinamide-nucleotide amidase